MIPRIEHGLPDEDGAAPPRPSRIGPRVAIVRYPAASNLDEFKALEQVARVRWATAPGDLRGADLVVLPGSKHVAADLAWLRERGFPAVLRDAGRVIGVCGGLQMLGGAIDGPSKRWKERRTAFGCSTCAPSSPATSARGMPAAGSPSCPTPGRR